MNAEMVMLIGSVSCFFLTLYWVRKRILRVKYALCWILVSAFILVIGIFPSIVKSAADACGLSYPALILLINLVVFYLFAFAVTISNSNHHRRTVKLIQELGLLDKRVSDLEQERDFVDSA